MLIRVGATQSDNLPNPPVVDNEDLRRAQEALARLASEMPNVAARSLNSTMKSVHTDVKKVLRATYNIKAGVIGGRIQVGKRASKDDISGYVRSKGYHIGLTTDLDSKAMAKQTDRGVEVNIRKDTGARLLPRTFIQPGRNSGKLIVLRRPGEPRGQSEKLVGRYAVDKPRLDAFYGPHPETLMNHPENWVQIQKLIAVRLDGNIEREIKAEFRYLGGK